MNIFLDTEFTNFPELECDLISIGLVDENGREFYAELTDYRQEACTDFVKDVVIPLLGKHENTVQGTRFQVGKQLLEWLQFYTEPVTICFDYHTDWHLMLRHLLWLMPDEELRTLRLTAENIWGSIDPMKLEWFWKEMDATKGWQPHQALWDAHGNRFAYRGPMDMSQIDTK